MKTDTSKGSDQNCMLVLDMGCSKEESVDFQELGLKCMPTPYSP